MDLYHRCDTQNCPFCRLPLVVEMFGPNKQTDQNSKIVSKVVEATNKKSVL